MEREGKKVQGEQGRNGTDEVYMRLALELALKGRGWVSPNPVVGAVIVNEAGWIIGQGFHVRYGDLHAERNALKNCVESPAGATMYVTLEPCCHQGRQPPCTDAILEAGIARVVVGSGDPNPLVSGKGIEILRAHGVEVTEGVLRDECDRANEIFFHYIRTGTPYVVMKYAMTLDGKIAAGTGDSKWITGEEARQHVQRLRGDLQAIMVGIGTVLADDPLLTCRLPGARNPVRIVCDSRLRIPHSSQLVRTAREVPTVIATASEDREAILRLEDLGCRVLRVGKSPGHGDPRTGNSEPLAGNSDPLTGKRDPLIRGSDALTCKSDSLMGRSDLFTGNREGGIDLQALMHRLGEEKIDSILLEGGGTLNWSALQSGIVQKVMAYVAPKVFGGESARSPVEGQGVPTPQFAWNLRDTTVTRLGEDFLIEGRL